MAQRNASARVSACPGATRCPVWKLVRAIVCQIGIQGEIGTLSVASETYRVQSARYREGATTILDLLEAQVNLSEAQVALIEANHAARLALAQIEALLGRKLFAQ